MSHYDTVARRNLLMEPAINPDLTHNVKAPDDLTLELFRDIGWFADADLDGVADQTDCNPQSDLTDDDRGRRHRHQRAQHAVQQRRTSRT